MVVLLTLRAGCSLLALKPAHLSPYLPASHDQDGTRQSDRKDALARTVTLVAIGGFVAFVALLAYLLASTSLTDVAWVRFTYLLTGIETVTFTAIGWLFGKEVHREQALQAEEQLNETRRQAKEQVDDTREQAKQDINETKQELSNTKDQCKEQAEKLTQQCEEERERANSEREKGYILARAIRQANETRQISENELSHVYVRVQESLRHFYAEEDSTQTADKQDYEQVYQRVSMEHEILIATIRLSGSQFRQLSELAEEQYPDVFWAKEVHREQALQAEEQLNETRRQAKEQVDDTRFENAF